MWPYFSQGIAQMVNDFFIPQNLVYAAGAFYVCGLLIIHQIALRLLVLCGTMIYVLYYATVAAAPLWEAFYISLMIGTANLIGIAGLLARQSRLAVPRAHLDIYPQFAALPPGDFRTLMRHATRRLTTTEMVLTVEDAAMKRLYYVISGETTIIKKGDRFSVPAGVFVGEVAYLTGQNASATTTLPAGSELLEWSSTDLWQACTRSTRFKMALESALSLDLAQKVAHSVAPHYMRGNAVPDQAESSFSNP